MSPGAAGCVALGTRAPPHAPHGTAAPSQSPWALPLLPYPLPLPPGRRVGVSWGLRAADALLSWLELKVPLGEPRRGKGRSLRRGVRRARSYGEPLG
jgi:hypothetical protein